MKRPAYEGDDASHVDNEIVEGRSSAIDGTTPLSRDEDHTHVTRTSSGHSMPHRFDNLNTPDFRHNHIERNIVRLAR